MGWAGFSLHGFPYCRAWVPDAWASAVVVPGLSC